MEEEEVSERYRKSFGGYDWRYDDDAENEDTGNDDFENDDTENGNTDRWSGRR
jgi:hypothetical protein